MAKRDWQETKATVIECRWKLIGYDDLGSGLALGEYVVHINYEVDGKVFEKRFRSSQSYAEGNTFNLRYDWYRPDTTDLVLPGRIKTISWIFGGLLTIALIWLECQMRH